MNKQISLLMLFFFIGCSAKHISNDQLFRTKHPEIAKYYITLDDYAFHLLEVMQNSELKHILNITDEIEKRKNNPDELQEYIEWLRKRNKDAYNFFTKEISAFRERLKKGDSVYYYKYKKDNVFEDGTIVLRNGDIVYRDVGAITDHSGIIDNL